MTAENSRAGAPDRHRPTAENPGEKFEGNGTPNVRQNATRRTDPLHVFAHGYLVVGTRGRCRLVMIVPRCPFCQGRPHVHNGKPSFQQGTRTASCHGGSYVVHLGTIEGEVAA